MDAKYAERICLGSRRVIQARIEEKDDLVRKDLIWIDLAYPSEDERKLVQSVFPLELPDHEELQDLEASARYHQDQHGVHIRSTFVQTVDEADSIVTMSFSLHQGRLLTVHDDDLTLLRLFRMQARSSGYPSKTQRTSWSVVMNSAWNRRRPLRGYLWGVG